MRSEKSIPATFWQLFISLPNRNELLMVLHFGWFSRKLPIAFCHGDHGAGVAVKPPDPDRFPRLHGGKGRTVGHMDGGAERLLHSHDVVGRGLRDDHLLGPDAGAGLRLDLLLHHGLQGFPDFESFVGSAGHCFSPSLPRILRPDDIMGASPYASHKTQTPVKAPESASDGLHSLG
nr:MAG TPA: hypothetical protein [Caudoviricetes sp.]